MYSRNRYFSNSLIGNPVTIKNNTKDFSKLDETLSSIKLPSGSDRELLSTISFSNPSVDTLETILTAFSIQSADDQVLEVMSLTKIQDPVAICTGAYFVKDTINSKIVKNSLSDYAFSFFKVLISNKEETNLTEFNKNLISISIDDGKFLLFIRNYLPKTYNLLSVLGNLPLVIQFYKAVFIYAINRKLLQTTNLTYSYFEVSNKNNKSTTPESNNYYDIDPQYNFYLKNYELTFNKDFVHTNLIPNYYAANSFLSDDNKKCADHLNLGNNIEISEQNLLSQEYFNSFSKYVRTSANDQVFLDSYVPIMQNVLVDSLTNKRIELSTENFPYVNSIKFKNRENPISNYLVDNGLETLALNNLFTLFYNDNLTQTTTVQATDEVGTSTLSTVQISTTNYTSVFSFNTTSSVGFNIKDNSAFIFDNSLEYLSGVKNLFKFIKLSNFFDDYFKNNNNYQLVNNLTPLQTEPVCYFIDKQTSNSIQQTIGLTCDKVNEITYNDTQITYEKPTTYSVSSVEALPEIIVNFMNDTIKNSYVSLTLDVATKLEYKFYKTLNFSSTVTVSDYAPVVPSVLYVPYKDIDAYVKILFNSTMAEIRETPINILDTDNSKFVNLLEKEKIKDGKITFQSVDPIDRVQVFRTTNKPTNYKDFANSLLEEVSFKNLSSTSYEMQTTPNIKYYMMFRAIDVHGLISNPTEVYELESISDSGAIYFVLNTINLNNNKNFNFEKSFRKYLSVKPSYDYSTVNQLEDGSVKFGIDDKLWNQKYKIRITSKKSGKSFDVNVRYVKKEIDLS